MANKQVKTAGQANQITTQTVVIGGKEVQVIAHPSSAKGR
jgi:hypothetical protein